MRICIDMDGTICETKKLNEDYRNVKPKPGAIEALKKLKTDGHIIIIHSSRNMEAETNNVAKIIAVQAPIFKEWFDKYEIEFDELLLGKPLADLYIDDKALKYNNDWTEIINKIKE